MNYLAHALLSFDKPEIIAGNLVADFVKGKKQYTFAAGIQQGIRLHRAIDAFTDDHAATRQAKMVFVPACGRYSGAFMDVVYDHFLARDPDYFSRDSLGRFSAHIYRTIESFGDALPENFDLVFHYMKKQDWLSGYYDRENIFNAFRGICRRAKYLDESDGAFLAFEKNYMLLHHYYRAFIPDLFLFSSAAFEQLTR